MRAAARLLFLHENKLYQQTEPRTLSSVLLLYSLAVEILRGGGTAALDNARSSAYRILAGLVDRLLILLGEPAEHPRCKIIVRARLLADTDLHARKILAAKVVNDVLQTVLAAGGALRAHA